jgi:hypothetical protein
MKVEVPPMERPLRLWKLGADRSATAPITTRFGSI